MGTQIHDIPIHLIYRNPRQPRKTFKQESLQELADSIKEHGVIEPIIVEHALCDQGAYMIVAGERRWRASKLAGMQTIRAIIQEASNHGGRERLIIGIVENVQREDMNPIEEAEAYRELIDVHSMTPNEVAQKTGKNPSWIYKCMKRLEVQPKVLELMRSGKLSADGNVVQALLLIENKKAQVGLAERAVKLKMTIPAIVAYAKKLNAALESKKVQKTGNAKSPAMNMARRHNDRFGDEIEPSGWDALEQLGKVPPWEAVVQAVNATCNGCELHDMASQAVCGNCPAVNLLVDLVNRSERVQA